MLSCFSSTNASFVQRWSVTRHARQHLPHACSPHLPLKCSSRIAKASLLLTMKNKHNVWYASTIVSDGASPPRLSFLLFFRVSLLRSFKLFAPCSCLRRSLLRPRSPPFPLATCATFEINLGRACMRSSRSLRPACTSTTVAHAFMSVYFMCSEAEISSAKLQWPYTRVL